MTGLARRWLVAGLATFTSLAAAGCTRASATDPGVPMGSYQLVFFDSCAQALDGLRAAAKTVVGPYGLLNGFGVDMGAGREGAAAPPQATNALPVPSTAGDSAKAGTPDYTGTNTHESNVDEPDLVKTDGKRIVTVSGGRLTVVDAASRRLIGAIDLGESNGGYEADLLIAGDHALVLSNQAVYGGVVVEDSTSGGKIGAPAQRSPIAGTSLILVDLTGPHVISRAHADGSIVDARQVGSTARVVVRSAPRLEFPTPQNGTDAERIAANRAIIDASDIADWTPRLEVTTDDHTTRSQVGCASISRPASYSATNMLTVLSFDIDRDGLDNGSPVSIVADGDTVYGSEKSLYVASNQAWRYAGPQFAASDTKSVPSTPGTEIYKFDTSGTAAPRFVAGGSVPGHLINQYAMSEWDGNLRIASTTDSVANPNGQQSQSQSGVYVLAEDGGQLKHIGSVEGLGKGERIYAVRFVQTVGYVVTFRQTDPLYTLDLGDPTNPTVKGALKIPGYSAYLHPADGTRLIGVGQDATTGGRVTGTQVSLFDVGDLTDPTRLAKYTLPGSYSEAEFDPHAFLYHKNSGLIVIPLQSRYGVPIPVEPNGGPGSASVPSSRVAPTMSGALVLRLSGNAIAEVGFVSHPGTVNNGGYAMPIRRSLLIDTTLWTVSGGGLMASDSRSLARLAWIPLA
jgi:uncharacterized secreted protein with C-terminal beta-propeller domain